MQKLKTGYAYFFCFFYNSINKVKGNIFVQFKAMLMVGGLEIMIIISIITYFTDITKISIPEDFNVLNLLFIVIPLVVLKLWFFDRNDRWKGYLEEFNALPLEKQKKWNRIMRGIVFFVFANLILAFYWMSQIDWRQYQSGREEKAETIVFTT